MAIQQGLYATSSSTATTASTFRRFLRELAVQDWLVLSYLTILNLAVLRSPSGPVRTNCLTDVAALLSAMVATLVLVRGSLLRNTFLAPLIYRFGVYGTVQLSYFYLADLLPLVNPNSLDQELYELDLMLFGIEPAMAMDSWVNSFTTEWFSFFTLVTSSFWRFTSSRWSCSAGKHAC